MILEISKAGIEIGKYDYLEDDILVFSSLTRTTVTDGVLLQKNTVGYTTFPESEVIFSKFTGGLSELFNIFTTRIEITPRYRIDFSPLTVQMEVSVITEEFNESISDTSSLVLDGTVSLNSIHTINAVEVTASSANSTLFSSASVYGIHIKIKPFAYFGVIDNVGTMFIITSTFLNI